MPFNFKIINAHKWLRSLLILTFGLIALGSGTAFITLDCHLQSGKPANPTLCNGIMGGAGDNTITVDQGQTVSGPFFGDGVIGNDGNDIIINNGTTVSSGGGTGNNGDIEGDVATGNGGDDVIVNNGHVAGDMDGDTVLGDGGNDVLINNGIVGDDMDGDNAGESGGDDVIINNGIVGGDIQADDNVDAANSHGGNDIIVINGTVEGDVDGDAGVKTGGDDIVVLQDGANGGNDNTLSIDGGGGHDTLVFNFLLPHPIESSVSDQIKIADPHMGSITINQQTFQWKNFEHLQSGLQELHNVKSTTRIIENVQLHLVIDLSHALVDCSGGRLIAVGLDNNLNSEWLFTVKADDLKASLAQAASNKADVKIAQNDRQTLSAMASDDLQLSDDRGRYNFTVAGEMCST